MDERYGIAPRPEFFSDDQLDPEYRNHRSGVWDPPVVIIRELVADVADAFPRGSTVPHRPESFFAEEWQR
ncbi:hypothetical protein GCM10023147_08830 [Tsukamurella soli]|uniref:Uncharacterized protein n=1 Tax=Tsukamurella soli TaxID=644556 RepID=A0ABP8J7D6_9ACTN